MPEGPGLIGAGRACWVPLVVGKGTVLGEDGFVEAASFQLPPG